MNGGGGQFEDELRQFAASFLKEYWLHFELTSVLLVVAVVMFYRSGVRSSMSPARISSRRAAE